MMRGSAFGWRGVWVALVAVATMVAPAATRAQPMADRVPADAVYYVACPGLAALEEPYERSKLRAVFEHTQLRQAVGQWLPAVIEHYRGSPAGPMGEKQAEVEQALAAAAELVQRYPWAIWIARRADTDETDKWLAAHVVVNAGDEVEAVRAKLQRLVDACPDKEMLRIVQNPAGLVGITTDLETDVLAGDGPEASLAQLDGFDQAGEAGPEHPVLYQRKNLAAVTALLERCVQMAPPRTNAGQTWAIARGVLGLSAVDGIWTIHGFDNGDWAEVFHVPTPGPQRGLLSMLRAEPLSEADVNLIPGDATLAVLGRFDLARALQAVREGLQAHDPAAAAGFAEGLRKLQGITGVNAEQDLAAALGDRWAIYTAPSVAGSGKLGMVLVNPLRDAAAFEQASQQLLAAVLSLANAGLMMGEVKIGEGQVQIQLQRHEFDGVTVQWLGTPGLTLAWAVHEGHLVAGAYPQVVASAVASMRGEGPGLAEVPAVAEAWRAGAGTGLVYANPNAQPGRLYQSMLALGRLAEGMGEMTGIQTPLLVPPLHQIREHLSPSVSVHRVDETGWMSQSRGPFPGATLFAHVEVDQLQLLAVGLIGAVVENMQDDMAMFKGPVGVAPQHNATEGEPPRPHAK